MAALAEQGEQFDSIVTDPPYELGFMGKKWDGTGIAFSRRTWEIALHLLKPGGHLLAFSGTRTYHRMACAIEDAGFDVRDMIQWIYGSGFPKSLNVGKAIDSALGEAGTLGDKRPRYREKGKTTYKDGWSRPWQDDPEACEAAMREYIPASDAAKQWNGWGTALKPACEPICFARKPLIGTVAQNVLEHGCGAINIDGCRIEGIPEATRFDPAKHRHDGWRMTDTGAQTHARAMGRDGEASANKRYTDNGSTNFSATPGPRGGDPAGRWPANVIHDGSDEVVSLFPETASGKPGKSIRNSKGFSGIGDSGLDKPIALTGFGYSGSAARFFYSAKASARERNGSKHPTVKPLTLMRYLCRLVTPPGGKILDPFAGSGTTGQAAIEEGFAPTLIEREAEYVADIKNRLKKIHGPLFEEAKQ